MGTFRTSRDVRSSVVNGGKPDVVRKANSEAIDPIQTIASHRDPFGASANALSGI
jgi:hypothetical protein